MSRPALRWEGSPLVWFSDHLQILDQRRLPEETAWIECRTAAEVAAAIRDMAVRGAPAIGCAAAFGLALDHQRGASIDAAQQVLAQSRPTAVNLFWALSRMRHAIDSGRDAIAEAMAIHAEDLAANRRMGALGAALIPTRARVMTYCNTGALATAGYGTALGVIRAAHEAGKDIRVWVNETRPYLQGARLTAWELREERIPATLIADNMAGFLMARGEVDCVIVGADRIAANGDVANKIGTYSLAVLAARHELPFYVAAPVSSFDTGKSTGADIPIEERPAEELTGYRGIRWAPDGVAVRNPSFDVTPAELITAIVCERGVIPSPDRAGVAGLLSR